MIGLDFLLDHLKQRWAMSQMEVCEQLVMTIRYAVYSPLDFIRSASCLLKENTESPQVQEWATECHKKSMDWVNGYGTIQERCLQNASNNETICKCLLQGIGSLFVNSSDLLLRGARLRDLVRGDMAQITDMIIQKLSVVAQFHSEDLSWLLRYIDEEDKLKQGHAF